MWLLWSVISRMDPASMLRSKVYISHPRETLAVCYWIQYDSLSCEDTELHSASVHQFHRLEVIVKCRMILQMLIAIPWMDFHVQPFHWSDISKCFRSDTPAGYDGVIFAAMQNTLRRVVYGRSVSTQNFPCGAGVGLMCECAERTDLF